MIISVGYRIKSKRGTQFRIWATKVLKDYLVRGYSLNQRRLAEKGIGEALTAASDTGQKDLLIRLIVNLFYGDGNGSV